MLSQTAMLTALVSAASCAVITVTVGDGGFVFKPNSVTAQMGDIVNFKYTGVPGNHTVSQSTFAAPCTQLSGGFDSGFVFVPPGFTGSPAEWNLTVTDTSKPIWFFCKQTNPAPHCLSGMVGAINAPQTGNTIDAFTNAAKALSSLPAETPGSLAGVGASASASPGPLASGASSNSAAGTSSPSGSATGTAPSSGSPTGAATGSTSPSPNAAVGVTSSGLWALLAAVLGITIA